MPLTGGVNERARQEIKAREREHRREGLTARTDHERHGRRDGASDRSRDSDDRRREQRRDSDRDRDRHAGRDRGSERDSRGDRQRDWGRDRRSGSDRGSERPPSERRGGGGGWEDNATPLRSAPRDEWEETPARAGGRAGSTAPSPNPYWQRGGSTPLIRPGTSSRGLLSLL